MQTKRLTTLAMLSAMCAVLGYLAIDLGNIKITFEALPVFLGGLLYGPLDGLLIGTIGTLIYQLLRYGVSLTTVLWILPYTITGCIVGFVAKKNQFQLDRKSVMITVVLCDLLITLLNTGVIYIDSKIYGWYYPALIIGSLALRLIVSIVRGVAFGAITPKLIEKLGNRGYGRQHHDS